jgi:hypothetical protein
MGIRHVCDTVFSVIKKTPELFEVGCFGKKAPHTYDGNRHFIIPCGLDIY